MTKIEMNKMLTELACVSQTVGSLGQRMRRIRNPNTKRAKEIDAAYVKMTNLQANILAEIRMALHFHFQG